MKSIYFLISVIALFLASHGIAETFAERQDNFPRVREARTATIDAIHALFSAAGVDYPPKAIFLRAFKTEKQLELWACTDSSAIYHLITTYDFTAYSGKLGPKRCRGDLQIPEGIYRADRFNPVSKFHLSIGLNYPNSSDRIRTFCPNPGGDIFIHGNAVTIGCIPIGDEAIEQLYIVAVDAKSVGQDGIPVHIFPFSMTESRFNGMKDDYASRPDVIGLWTELYPIYRHFDSLHMLPTVIVDSSGAYGIR